MLSQAYLYIAPAAAADPLSASVCGRIGGQRYAGSAKVDLVVCSKHTMLSRVASLLTEDTTGPPGTVHSTSFSMWFEAEA